MLFRLALIFLTLIFIGILESSIFKGAYFFHYFFGLIIFSFLGVWPLLRKKRFLALPLFLGVGSLCLLYLIDSKLEQHIFVGLSGVVFYLSLLGGFRLRFCDFDQTAQGMVNLATISSAFFWFVASYGWFLNFKIEVWVLILAFSSAAFFVSLPSLLICEEVFRGEIKNWRLLKKIKHTKEPVNPLLGINKKGNIKIVVYLSFILALILGQIIWSLSTWPFGYLTTGTVALLFYFIFWDSIRLILIGRFSKKNFVANLIGVSFAIFTLLFTSHWNLVN